MTFYVNELKKIKKYENGCLKHSLLVFDYQILWTPLHKTSLICLNIFHDNTIIVYVITFLNKKLNKLCDLMRNSFELNTYLFF